MLAAGVLGAVLATRKVYRNQYCEVTDWKEPARTSGRTDILTVKSGFVWQSTFRKLLIKADVARHRLCQGSLPFVQYRRSVQQAASHLLMLIQLQTNWLVFT
jgi:hypothetical protein